MISCSYTRARAKGALRKIYFCSNDYFTTSNLHQFFLMYVFIIYGYNEIIHEFL
jgi:hypothetical protein